MKYCIVHDKVVPYISIEMFVKMGLYTVFVCIQRSLSPKTGLKGQVVLYHRFINMGEIGHSDKKIWGPFH